MKKILALILTVSVMISMVALAVSAEAFSLPKEEKTQSLVVFGDSISTGYGLEGTVYSRPSYANLVASALELSEGKGYVNYAVDGYTSADILAKAKEKASDVAGADLILLTCGGNDVLGKMLAIAFSAGGGTTTDLKQLVFSIMFMPAAELNAKLYSEENQLIIDRALEQYRTNMLALTEYLRKNAPDAQIVFLTQYNPLSGVSLASVLDAYAEDVIGRLNSVMVETAAEGGCETVDTHAVMIGQGMQLSNIMSSDIHPNAAGHEAMAAKVKTYLNIVDPAVSETETTTAPEMTTTLPEITTAIPETTTVAPEMTTTLPETTTAAPEVTTTAIPAVTTAIPEATTTSVPAVTTTVPAATTTVPAATTAVAEVTTTAPQTTVSVTTTSAEPQTTVSVTTTSAEPQTTESAAPTSSATENTTATTAADVPSAGTDEPAPDGKSVAAPVAGIVLIIVGVTSVTLGIVLRKKH